MDLFEMATAMAERNAAIASVTTHAEQNHPGWNATARDWIVSYSATHREFISEQCVESELARPKHRPSRNEYLQVRA